LDRGILEKTGVAIHAEFFLQVTSSSSFPQWTDQDDAESCNGRVQGRRREDLYVREDLPQLRKGKPIV
jgi:hypothetical protein